MQEIVQTILGKALILFSILIKIIINTCNKKLEYVISWQSSIAIALVKN